MPVSRFEKLLPLTGVLAGVLFAVNGFVSKVPSEYGDPAALQMMKDNMLRNFVAAIAGGLFCVAMVFFATAVRRALRTAEGGEATYSVAAFGGGLLLAASKATDGWLMLAGIDAADQGDRATVATLGYLGMDSWLPWVAASAAFFLATGLGALRNAVLPRWLAIATVVLGVLCLLGPTGVAVYVVTPVWLVLTGVVLSRRQASEQEVSVPGPSVRV
jgi:hypothetical protein